MPDWGEPYIGKEAAEFIARRVFKEVIGGDGAYIGTTVTVPSPDNEIGNQLQVNVTSGRLHERYDSIRGAVTVYSLDNSGNRINSGGSDFTFPWPMNDTSISRCVAAIRSASKRPIERNRREYERRADDAEPTTRTSTPSANLPF